MTLKWTTSRVLCFTKKKANMGPKEHIVELEEIGGPDLVGVVVEKGLPVLDRCPLRSVPHHRER